VRNPAERPRDIVKTIERHQDGDRPAFEADALRHAWFLRHLQIIGEAARALPPEVRTLAPEIPWPKIIGMRNILVHGYFEIDTDIVWQAVTNDVPVLKPAIASLLALVESRG
jgi:uncharacterized protein with HEPN domain